MQTEYLMERTRWLPCHFIGEDGTGVISCDDLFWIAQKSTNEEAINNALDMLNATLMANSIILNMIDGNVK